MSRGIPVQGLQQRWKSEPDFLKRLEEKWPQTTPTTDDNKVNLERRDTPVVGTVDAKEEVINKFSGWRKLIRVTAWIQRVGRKVPERQRIDANDEANKCKTLTPDDLNKAELHWIKYAQRDLHGKIKTGELKQFSPFVDNKGIIRVGGRLSKAIVTYDCKHPVMLPYKQWISLLITRQHCRNNRKESKEVLDSTSANERTIWKRK